MKNAESPSIGQLLQQNSEHAAKTADGYLSFYQQKNKTKDLATERTTKSTEMTKQYYDLATDFFEYGWGESFHFYVMCKEESRQTSCLKHEYRLAVKLGLKAGLKCLDLGCGIGGPARHLADLSGASILGVNCNKYQLHKCKLYTEKAKLQHLVQYQEEDFCGMSLPDNSFDRAYAIEATCHAGDVAKCFSEVYRVLKPGGVFAFYEWCMTESYDPNNDEHVRIKMDIMEGDSLPDIRTKDEVKDALRGVGFELLEATDLADPNAEVTWYSSLQGNWTLADFKTTPVGRWCTHMSLRAMETLGLAPKGSTATHTMLCKGADGLVQGGLKGIFTPMYLLVVQKPH